MPVSSFDRIVDLLNEASLTEDTHSKITKLLQVKELTVHHESSLLDNFFEEVAAFQHDPNFEVRKVVIGFIEEACQVDPTLLKKALGYLFYLFSSAVQHDPPAQNLLHSLCLALVSIYRLSLARAVKVGVIESGVNVVSSAGIQADSAADIALENFRSVSGLKDEFIRLLLPQAVSGQSSFMMGNRVQLNDNVRLSVIRLIESIIILQSRRLPNSEIPANRESDISLDQIPDMTNAQLQAVLEASTAPSSATLLPGICLVRPRRLSDEAERLLSSLLDWPVRGKSATSTGPISCSSLEGVMECLVAIATQRPQFMDRVVQLFETVHVNCPPYFSDVQVANVRKKLKVSLLQLLRHPTAISDYQGRITILLTDLGATQTEVMEALNRPSERRRASLPDHGDVDMRRNPSQMSPSNHNAAWSTTTSMVSSLPSTTSQPRDAKTAENQPIIDPETALCFDDDDDEDDDDEEEAIKKLGKTGLLSQHSSRLVKRSTKSRAMPSDRVSTSTASSILTQSRMDLPSVDFVTTRLEPKLTSANVADLVLLSMVTLPDQMPAAFHSTYTPIAAAGTSAQIHHLARMLAVQLVVWAGEGSNADPTENLSQLETLLRPSQDELKELGVPEIRRSSSKSEGVESAGTKSAQKGKRRRSTMELDTETDDEDAMIRANVARRLHGGQPMNISTLVNYNQQLGAVPTPFDNSKPPPGILPPMFNPSQPPPLLPPGIAAQPPVLNVNVVTPVHTVSLPIPDTVSVPLPGRPFSLDAVTVPLGRNIQRQLARDAFVRILEELEDAKTRRPVVTGTEGQLLLPNEFTGTTQHLVRMKLLTRLTTRRFGGNEFYNILIDNAIKNLRNGFELLSKLLMQEYCRFRGFQLVGFDPFLQSRREQLKQLRSRHSAPNASSSPKEDLKSEPSNVQEKEEPSQDTADSTATSLDDPKEDHDEQMTDQSMEQPDDHSTAVVESKPTSTPMKSLATSQEKTKSRVVSSPDDLGCLSFYDCLLIQILERLTHPDVRQSYFGRFLLEAPLLTPGALSVLKRYCCTPSQTRYGFEVLRMLIELRPVSQREDLLNLLLNFCAIDNTEVRQSALAAVRDLVSLDSGWREHIEAFAIRVLRKLLQPRPTPDIFPLNSQPTVPASWNDETCQACAHLFLGLMPQSPPLMNELAKVYVGAIPEVKRCILRMVDTPIREIGLYSAAIHHLVDNCPIGAETLVTRMIHLLTDSPSAIAALQASKVPSVPTTVTPVIVPPPSLVDRVYRLYRERVDDIRCLIPVLVGLPKSEVIAVLPRLVQLSEKVVKEVLTRLLHASVSTQYAPIVKGVQLFEGDLPDPEHDEPPLGPIKPEELLVAVHLLEFAKDPAAPSNQQASPTKPYVSLQAILHACRVCFAERRLFTQERLSVAIGQLLDQPTLPTLFMRTVMQALALHPRLAGYVINVLVNLIPKQIWKSDKLWDGFIRCCIKTRPQSYQVLLQLPPDRLEDVFKREPAIRSHVRRYVENFSSAQRVHISKSIIEVLERSPTPKKSQAKAVKESKSSAASRERLRERSPSPGGSSGPGTPTRDEVPSHLSVSAAPSNLMPLPVVVGGRMPVESSHPRVESARLGGRPRELSPFSHEVKSEKNQKSSDAGATSKMSQAVAEPPSSQTPPPKKRRSSSDEPVQRIEQFDQSPLDWSTDDLDNEQISVQVAPEENQTRRQKRVVDVEKLEADRKRLEEEASKHKRRRSGRKRTEDAPSEND